MPTPCVDNRGRVVADPSAARVVLRMQLLQALARHMGVDLRRRQVAVAEQHLHHAQVRTVVQQWVAKAWRSVCGDKGFTMPASMA
jgi:hypothetical protein